MIFIFIYFLVIFSYLLGSIFFKKQQFYYFDPVWRIIIILGLFFLGRIRFSFTLFQWLVLFLVFLSEVILVKWFCLKFFRGEKNIIKLAVGTLVLAPLMEEFFFRGFILNLIEGSFIAKIILGSLFFGFYHLKNAFLMRFSSFLYQILYATFVIGPFLSFVKLTTNSIFLCIIFHSFNNAIAITLTRKFLPFLLRVKF